MKLDSFLHSSGGNMKRIKSVVIVLLSVVISGCSNANIGQQEMDNVMTETEIQVIQDADDFKEIETFVETDNIVDYSEYFQGISGCAVLYDELSNTYSYYNKENCETEVSPLSTFKIVSTLAGLENNVLENEETTMEYSGMKYPIDTWNSNLTLGEAFENSCVWYFRQVVDKVGQENIQSMLAELQYGNRDISEWNGSNVNSLPELNGFWLESSLKISPLQQVNVLHNIFSGENNFSSESIETLKHIMYISEFENGSLYGKTGSGTNGEAWFIGFIEKNDNRIYFAVYLEDMQNKDIVSGNKAKEIAISILSNNSEIQDSISFDDYSGHWSYGGKTHEQILAEGGLELFCTIIGDNQFSGTLFSQQAITERFASIENISGKIEQGELYFDYTDDEWGNSGTLHIQFLSDSIYVEVLNYRKADGGSDYGISGSFELIRQKEDIAENYITDNSSYNSSWTEEEIIKAINERSQYYISSAYYSEIIDYWENVREVRDISNVIEPLFETDKEYYTIEEFESEPMMVIHLAKNEIYARHGYIFSNEDLFNYFMGCIWYSPTCDGTDFDDSIFNEYEKANLEILSNLDTY